MKLLLSQVITYDLIADIGIKWQKFPSHPFHHPTFPSARWCSVTQQLWIHTTTTESASSSNENEPAQNPNSMHKVDDKFHGHWPSHPTSLIIDKIQNCCRIFLSPPSSALNNFCWCSENWWWCCACCSNQVRLEFMLKSHLPFYKLDVGSRRREMGKEKRARQNLNVCRETMRYFFEVNDGATEPCTHKLHVYASRCVCMDDRKIEGNRRLGQEWKRREYPTKASINDCPCGSIVCVGIYLYMERKKKETEEKCFFLRPHPRCTAAVRAAIPAREVKLNLSLRAM